MADNSDSRESENNSWVMAGSEALPVEDLGLETSEEPQIEEDLSEESGQEESARPIEDAHPEEPKAKIQDPGVEADVSAEKTPTPLETPESISLLSPLEKEPGGQEPEKPSEPTPQISIQKVGPFGEETTTSSSGEEFASRDRDVEGLRRRKGQDPTPLRPAAPGDRDKAVPGGEDGDRTKWLFGLFALTGLGLLVVLGVILDTEDGPTDIQNARLNVDGDKLHPDGSDQPAFLLPEPPGDIGLQRVKEDHRPEAPKETQSLDAMGVLLDKLAKENQDIRLMQAELQAQKEELQALLAKTEGEALEFTSQHQALATKNAQLLEALQQEKSSLLAAQAELQLLRDRLQILGDAQPDSGPLPVHHRRSHESREAEIRQLRDLLASIRRDVVRASKKVPPSKGAEEIQAELGGVGQRLAQELEEEEGIKPLKRESPRRRKEKASPKRPSGPEERHSDGAKMASDRHHHHPRKHGTRDAKPGKDWEDRRAVRKAKKLPRTPSELWEMLAKRTYKAPKDCANVIECAHQEGLAPVQKVSFLHLVQSYLAGLGWAEHYEGLANALGGFFGSDGAFAHDQVSFVDFLDEVEDALEALAKYLGRSREEPDDFEEVILKQVGALPGSRFTHRDGGRQQLKERNHNGYGRRNGREAQG